MECGKFKYAEVIKINGHTFIHYLLFKNIFKKDAKRLIGLVHIYIYG